MIKYIFFCIGVFILELNIENAQSWSEFIFAQSDFNDKRLTKRLIQIGGQLSMHAGRQLSAIKLRWR